MEPLMTSDEVAAYLRVDVVTIRRLVNRGELPAYRVGGEYRFRRQELEEYLQGQRVPAANEPRADLPGTLAQFAQKFFGSSKSGSATPLSSGFERFTTSGRSTLSLAQEEAQRLHHNYMGTEHVLLGLVRESEGIGAQVLTGMGVELEKVRFSVELIIGQGDHAPEEWSGRLTPRVKKVIELAVDEARRLDQQYIGSEHLLLGLIREGRGIGAEVLKKLGVDLALARAKTLELVAEKQADEPPESAAGTEGADGEQEPRSDE